MEKTNYRFKSLDGVRGLACLMVVYSHYIGYNSAEILVLLFMCLSGFVLKHQFDNKKSNFKSFFLTRMARLFPILLISVFIFFLLYYILLNIFDNKLIYDFDTRLSYLFLYIFNIQGIISPEAKYFTNAPSWSISIEFYTNIIFFFIIYKIRNYRAIIFYIYMTLLILYIFLLISDYKISNLEFSFNDNIYKIYFGYLFLPTMSFLSGILIYDNINNIKTQKFSNIHFTFLEIIMIIILLLSYRASSYGVYFKHVLIVFMPIFILIFSHSKGMISKYFFNNIFLQYLGQISFALYIIHHIIKDFYVIFDVRYLFIQNIHVQTFIWMFIAIIFSHIIHKIDMYIYKKNKEKINLV